jgi:hypothetical protein
LRAFFGRPPRSSLALGVTAILALHCTLIVCAARSDSPTLDEIGHLPAGLSHWQLGRFELYAVDPPLVRMVAAIPLAVAGVEMPWKVGTFVLGRGGEFLAGVDFIGSDPERAMFWYAAARWFCLSLSLVGSYTCLCWASELYGRAAGAAALALWCFSPSILANAHLIAPDAGAAAMGVAAAYGFWRWLRRPTWPRALGAGSVLGLAELAKTTWVVLFPLWAVLWLVWRCATRRNPPRVACEAAQVVAILAIAVWTINLGYGFEGSLERLGDYHFASETLRGPSEASEQAGTETGNRFEGTWVGAIPVPLPQNYVLGIDFQKHEFEAKKWSYLRGQWRRGGWWYYYLYALGIKEPLGTWALAALAVVVSIWDWRRRKECHRCAERDAGHHTERGKCNRAGFPAPFPEGEGIAMAAPPAHRAEQVEGAAYNAGWRDELVLLAPAIAVLVLVSSQTGLNHHVRYVLPALPFIFIWTSKVARSIELRHWKIGVLAAGALAWSIVSSLSVGTHSLSYFNELAGGPLGGHYHLGNSNMDWGQDLMNLKRWLDKHPEAQPLTLAYDLPLIDPKWVGVEYGGWPPTDGPHPGWHAISVNLIHRREGDYKYFLEFRPVGMAGYSIYVYHISTEEADRVRRKLGLPWLTEAQKDGRPQHANQN